MTSARLCASGSFRSANFAPSFLEHDSRTLGDQASEFAGIPVCEPDAPVRLGIADLSRVRRAVDTVVRIADSNPHHAHWIVRPRRNRRLGTGGIGIPKQGGVVVVGWISPHLGD